MHKSLLLLCILSITICAHAQQFNKEWVEGRYYSRDGALHKGLIKYTAPKKHLLSGDGDHIFYKPDENAEKAEIDYTELKAFVIGVDSFVVSHDVRQIHAPIFYVMYDHPTKLFASVIAVVESREALTQNGNMVSVGFGKVVGQAVAAYYYGPDIEHITKLDRKHYVEIMSDVMGDKPAVVKLIKDKVIYFSEMDELIKYYNRVSLPPAPEASSATTGSN